MIHLENQTSEDQRSGKWGYSLEELYFTYGKKISLDQPVIEGIVQQIELRKKRLIAKNQDIEHAVNLLARYYDSVNNEAQLLNLLEELYTSKKELAQGLGGFHEQHALESSFEYFRDYNQYQNIKEKAKEILTELSNFKVNLDKELSKVSSSINVEKEHIDNIKKLIHKDRLGDSLYTIVKMNFPDIIKYEELFKEIIKAHPIQYLCSTQQISEEGLRTATIGSIEDNYDKHFTAFYSRNVAAQTYFLAILFDEVREQFSAQQIHEFIASKELFKDEDPDYLYRAIQAFYDKDYIVASHLLIPLIETAIRELIKKSGGTIIAENKIGGYKYLLLNKLFEYEELLNNVFESLNKDATKYFKTVLHDNIGMNLRNDFAHGIGKSKFKHRQYIDILFHILLCFSLVK